MTKRRPTAVTVMGILNIIFGSLGLLCSVCGGIGLLLLFNVPDFAGKGQPNPFRDMMETFERELPFYMPFTIASLLVGIVMSAILLIAGIGLLNMKGWGRIMSITYSIVTILIQIVTLIFHIAIINPAIQRWQEEFLRKAGAPPGGAAMPGTGFENVSSVVGAVIGMTYAIVLLVMMLLPNVSAAFAGRPQYDDYEADRHGDQDEGYDRRRGGDEGWGN